MSKVDSANCVWVIKEKTNTGFQGEPLGMVIAYVDDLIAVGQQNQLDGMKASLDALYTMKTSGAIPAQYQEGIEPLKFLGCFIERLPDGEIIMHQRSYIDHCLKNNDMMMRKPAKGLLCVDEKSPPEDPYEEDGTPTSFESDKAICQKYIGQLMWLTTRTRPDFAATLGILASQMVIRPGYIRGCLVHLWRFILGTKDLNMRSFEPGSIEYGSLVLNVYVDASFASGGGRSRSGLAMYLVNPVKGTESLIQWASRRQTSMATSAPEAEVSATAEGYAASIFLFDTLSELGLVSGSGPSALMSMKTDSAVALKQLGTQSVTVRTRTAAQKLHYLRELIYENPQVEPIYISGESQRADGLTKILSGKALTDSQESLNLFFQSSLLTTVQEKRVSTKQYDMHAHLLEDTKTDVDTPRVCTFRMDRQDESRSLDSIHDENRTPSRYSIPQHAATSQGLNAPSSKTSRRESRSMESTSAPQPPVNLDPQGSSMEAEPVIPSVEVDSPESTDSETISSPHTRPIDLEEEEEDEPIPQSWEQRSGAPLDMEALINLEEKEGIAEGDFHKSWARMEDINDVELEKRNPPIDRSKVRTYHLNPELLEAPQETSFKKPTADIPAWKIRKQFVEKLSACKLLIVKAPTGSGKSTIFPALAAKVMPKERIWCTQVKRSQEKHY